MILTFGQYSLLMATRHRLTHKELISQTNFDQLMVNYYIAGLLTSGLIMADADHDDVCYKLTEAGLLSIEEYERDNPALIIKEADQ